MAAVLGPDTSHEPLIGRERIVWHSQFGDILIEIVGEDIYVDGKRVERSVGEASQASPSFAGLTPSRYHPPGT